MIVERFESSQDVWSFWTKHCAKHMPVLIEFFHWSPDRAQEAYAWLRERFGEPAFYQEAVDAGDVWQCAFDPTRVWTPSFSACYFRDEDAAFEFKMTWL